jgi:hypothetical protein
METGWPARSLHDFLWEEICHFVAVFFTLALARLARLGGMPRAAARRASFLVFQFKLQAFQGNLKFTEMFLQRLKNEQRV